MKSTLFWLVVLVAPSAFADSQIIGDWESAKTQGTSAVESGDCALAWNLIWPWARKGQVEARAILAGGVVVAELTPPGSGKDAISRFRHAVILAVHGAAEGDRTATELLDGFLRIDIVLDMGGRPLKRCFEAGILPATCVGEAVKSGFVPDFRDYAREVDAVSKSAGAAQASCGSGNKNRE